MTHLPLLLALAAMALVLTTWVVYLSTIYRDKVPVYPNGALMAFWLGIAMATGALVLGVADNPWLIAPAGMAILPGLAFFWLIAQRKTPLGKITVKVGDTLPHFQVRTQDDAVFESDALAGKRVLLKFFRGGW